MSVGVDEIAWGFAGFYGGYLLVWDEVLDFCVLAIDGAYQA